VPLKKLIDLYPAQTGAGNAYALLALACRNLNETEQEREALARLAALGADATEAYLRLMELGEAAQDWPAVAENAARFLAVNPLLPQPHRYLARASEELGKAPEAIDAYRRLLLIEPPDPAEVHFRLARLLHRNGDAAAKRHVLQALEEAPRFRDAHRLLLELNKTGTNQTETARESEPPPPLTP
jgi:tetratricopeptide (TPR) repeat protein